MGGRPLVDRVVAERQRRGLTIRQAAASTDITNTTWSRWENEGGAPSPKMRTAVAQAFGWEPDWPENPPPLPVPTDHGPGLTDLDVKLDRLIDGQVAVSAAVNSAIARATKEVAAAIRDLVAPLAELQRGLDELRARQR